MSITRFRTVKAPHGTLVHFDYLNDGRTDDTVRSTSCGRKVPATWTVTAVSAEDAAQLATCWRCQTWAQFHLDREAVDAQLAVRLGDNWKDQPGNYLPAVDLRRAQQLLTRLQELDDLGETPAPADTAVTQQLLDAGFTPARAQEVVDARDRMQAQLDAIAATPLASCTTSNDAGRRVAVRNNAAAAARRMASAMRSLPAAGTPSLC